MDHFRARAFILGFIFAHSLAHACTDFIFVIDGSANLKNKFQLIMDIALNVASELDIDFHGHRVAVLEFGSEVRAHKWPRYNFGQITSQGMLEHTIDKLPSLQGVSNKGKAFEIVVEEFLPNRRDNTPLVILTISDGHFRSRNERKAVDDNVARLASEKGVHLFAATSTKDHNLPGMVSFTNGDASRVAAGEGAVREISSLLEPYIDCPAAAASQLATRNERAFDLHPPTAEIVRTTAKKSTTAATTTATTTRQTSATQAKTTQRITQATLRSTTPSAGTTQKVQSQSKTTRSLRPIASAQTPSVLTSKQTAIRSTTPRQVVQGVTTARPPQIATSKPGCQVDIIFLMDFSGGAAENREAYVTLASSLVKELELGPNNAQVGMVRYSGPGRTNAVFHLNKHTATENAVSHMIGAEHMGGTTRTGEAILYTIDEFGERYGGRKNAKKILIVFTDGYSQEDPTEASQAARNQGIELRAVAIENESVPPNKSQLNEITGNPKEVYSAVDFDRLRSQIVNPLRRCS